MEIRNPNHEIREAIVPCFDLDIYGIKSEFELRVFRISTFDIRIFMIRCSLFIIHLTLTPHHHDSYTG
jgi:hypothetical protein